MNWGFNPPPNLPTIPTLPFPTAIKQLVENREFFLFNAEGDRVRIAERGSVPRNYNVYTYQMF